MAESTLAKKLIAAIDAMEKAVKMVKELSDFVRRQEESTDAPEDREDK